MGGAFWSLILFLSFFQMLCARDFEPTASYPVGNLGKKWRFPSDHLPVGATLENIHLALWNILNTRYIHHIETNHQGLNGSLITESNVPHPSNPSLTAREGIIIDKIIEMVEHPVFPRALLALQETGEALFRELCERLPDRFICLTPYPNDLASGDLFLFDKQIFDFVSFQAENYRARPRYTFMRLVLQEKETGRHYHFIQSHIPGGPVTSVLARKELAEEILKLFDEQAVTIVLGDMNRSPDIFSRDLREAACEMGLDRHPLMNVQIPYPTHVDTCKRATWIDNLFVFLPDPTMVLEATHDPVELFSELENTVDLLQSLHGFPLNGSFQIWTQLKVFGFAVIYGTRGLGKWEQIRLACQGQPIAVFDLKQAFLNAFVGKHEIVNQEEKAALQVRYLTEKGLIDLEQEWVQAHQEQIIEACIAEPAEIVVFDEFDLSAEYPLSFAKKNTMLSIINIAKGVFNAGKKVILVVQQGGSSSQEFWGKLCFDFSFCKGNMIKTGYFSNQEELSLLSLMPFSEEEKKSFMEWALGTPAAYLESIDEWTFPSRKVQKDPFLSFCNQALLNVGQLFEELALTGTPELIELLKEMAFETLSVEEGASFPQFWQLVDAGLVGMKEKKWVISPLVKKLVLTNLSGD